MKRATSGAFTQLSSTQIHELKESFQMLDKDGDGVIGKEDLSAMLGSLGTSVFAPYCPFFVGEGGV
jgi:Ca2+-binding EF-hand superfamily protein